MSNKNLSIFLLEPFYGGSHKLWADQIKKHSQHRIRLFTMPDRFWKWRMRGSALHLAELVNQEPAPDLIFVSDMIDLPLFKDLCKHKNTPVTLYMHENQFAYPDKSEDDFTYAFANFTSALVADSVVWNSHYNIKSFLEGCKDLLRRLPDYTDLSSLARIKSKSEVIYPGLPSREKTYDKEQRNAVPIILWNHRREHDKGPEQFFKSLFRLQEEGIPFSLIVMGEAYSETPGIFAEAKERLSNQILHWGYVETRNDYETMLKRADILPVTSEHDFFGISVWEAVRTGVYPLLPERLSYPEILSVEENEKHFYAEGEFYQRLKEIALNRPLIDKRTVKMLNEYSIEKYIEKYDDYFVKTVK